MTRTASDSQTTSEVLDALRYDVRIDETNVRVDVANGVVYLSGSVPTFVQKVTAGHDAQRIKGVRQVKNDLTVHPVTAWTDVEIGRVIRGTLDHDARIADASQIDVRVKDSVVTLTGTVRSVAERANAAGDAWVAPGVINVVNDLMIIPGQARSDVDIAANVRSELTNDPFLDATGINVQVTNGIVYLRGTVASDYQLHEAQHNAWRVAGIRDVANELHIAA